MSPALAIFVKTPALSPVKTRLAAGIGRDRAIRFYSLAAAATAETVSACGAALAPYWAVAETAARDGKAWPGFPSIWQGTGGLGARLHRIHHTLRKRHGAVLMIGADTPQLTPALLMQAVAAVHEPGVAHAIGPASDGGFWLFGGRRAVPLSTWNAVRYSRHDTAAALERALQCNGRLVHLPTLTDIDTVGDLRALDSSLRALPTPGPTQRALLDYLQAIIDDAVRRTA